MSEVDLDLASGVRLRAGVRDESLVGGARAFLRHMSGYVDESRASLKSGEKVGYGYWIVKLVEEEDGVLTAHESSPDGSGWVPGVDNAVRYWIGQHAVCRQAGAPFSPPRPDQYAAISEGVLAQEPTQGVRYSAPEHMSGWYLTTPSFDGGAEDLKIEHLYHVTAARPDVARFISLPVGYRFDTGTGEAWFDSTVANE